ncbi:MAG: 4-hydroxy-tetrahydrodipicolinate reductase [Alphaproteobacteria bacterium]|nr:4-hydroxy-tetrahydrodipicolinate reductase [Alphaproteobacteria bacterium]
MNIGIAGCTGRVGSLLCREILSGHWGRRVRLAGGTVKEGLPGVGEDIGIALNLGGAGARIMKNAEEMFSAADVIIDFTSPEAVRHHAWLAAKHHKPYIVGTTGLNANDERELHDAANEAPIVYAANMSVGVNMLLALVEQAASKLGDDWDIEIFEAHHKHKVDAPSGTALALGKAASRGRGQELDHVGEYARHGKSGERRKGSIGFSVARGGDVVGEHTVTFYAEGERIELGHKATNRALFARGAIRAALWAVEQKNGLYSMRDVLGL